MSPWDLKEVSLMTVRGCEVVQARPYALDSEIVDFDKCTNAWGKLVQPSRMTTTCPACGQGNDLVCNSDDKYQCACYVPKNVKKVIPKILYNQLGVTLFEEDLMIIHERAASLNDDHVENKWDDLISNLDKLEQENKEKTDLDE